MGIYSLGCCEVIISDQGREFVNAIQEELFQCTGTKQKVSSAYHPQTNGLTEQFNQTLQASIANQNDRDERLSAILFAYRTSVQKPQNLHPLKSCTVGKYQLYIVFYITLILYIHCRKPKLPIDMEYALKAEDIGNSAVSEAVNEDNTNKPQNDYGSDCVYGDCDRKSDGEDNSGGGTTEMMGVMLQMATAVMLRLLTIMLGLQFMIKLMMVMMSMMTVVVSMVIERVMVRIVVMVMQKEVMDVMSMMTVMVIVVTRAALVTRAAHTAELAIMEIVTRMSIR